MNDEGRAACGEGGELFRFGSARRVGESRQHHALRYFGHGQLAFQGRRRRREGRHARRQRIGYAAPREPTQLLG